MFIENRGIGLRIGHESGILGEIEESVNAYTSFVIASGVERGGLIFTASDQWRDVSGVVAVADGLHKAVYRAEQTMTPGDSIYWPLVVEGTDLDESTLSVEGDEDGDIEVVETQVIGPGCVVLELKAHPDADKGSRNLKLVNGSDEYSVSIWIENGRI